MASRALAASSGVRTLPSASRRSRTSSRRCRGTSGAGGSMKRSYMSYRPSRPISRASRNPAVVRSPVLAPLRSISALVASVVPWMRAATLAGPRPASWRRVSTPCSTAWAGSLGVVRSLPTLTAPVASSTSTRSVKVPPMSTPMREPPRLVALIRGKCTGSRLQDAEKGPSAEVRRPRPHAHAGRTGAGGEASESGDPGERERARETTPRVRPSGAASHLDLFEHPAAFSATCQRKKRSSAT